VTNRLNILVSCSNRKSLDVLADLQFRNVAGATVEERLENWIARVDSANFKRVPAKHVYQGDHWQVCLGLVDVAAKIGIQAELWIGSAGYGLLHWRDAILGYSATFSARHEDSVLHGAATNAELAAGWWKRLAQWTPSGIDGPRSVHELVIMDPGAAFMAVGSPTYLSAWQPDLERALEEIDNPQRFFLTSAGSEAIGKLEPHLLPADARFQSHVEGSLVSLNARVAELALRQAERGEFALNEVKERLEGLLEQLPEQERYDRERLADEQILQLIKDRLSSEPSLKRTPLLRLLRDDGYACEQGRFKRLYTQALEERERPLLD
jgi:hypothetical protein